MTTKIIMRCDGCDDRMESERVHRQFRSVNGRGYGFGQWHTPTIDEVVEPSGWIWSDPYTSCTYCPKCWAEIESEVDRTQSAQASAQPVHTDGENDA